MCITSESDRILNPEGSATPFLNRREVAMKRIMVTKEMGW